MAWLLLPRWVHRMTYPIPDDPVPSPPPSPIVEVFLETSAHEKLVAWLLPAAREDAPVVIFFHGNGQDLGTMLFTGFLHRFPQLGVHLLAVEYPGYGNSEGVPGEASLRECGELAMDWVLMNYPDVPKVIMGWSLGAAVAVETGRAFQGHYDGLILLSPWTSLRDVGRAHFPAWMVRLLMRENYDSLKAVSSIKVPSLVIHGRQDDIIPSSQGVQIAEALGRDGPCQLIMLEGRRHNDILDSGLTWTHLQYFFENFASGEP